MSTHVRLICCFSESPSAKDDGQDQEGRTRLQDLGAGPIHASDEGAANALCGALIQFRTTDIWPGESDIEARCSDCRVIVKEVIGLPSPP